MVNKELLLKTLETIENNPQHWNQETWHCGTTHCFAGFAELLAAGLPIDSTSASLKIDTDLYNLKTKSWGTFENSRRLLGLSDTDAKILFNPTNTLKKLKVIVYWLTECGSLEWLFE